MDSTNRTRNFATIHGRSNIDCVPLNKMLLLHSMNTRCDMLQMEKRASAFKAYLLTHPVCSRPDWQLSERLFRSEEVLLPLCSHTRIQALMLVHDDSNSKLHILEGNSRVMAIKKALAEVMETHCQIHAPHVEIEVFQLGIQDRILENNLKVLLDIVRQETLHCEREGARYST